MSCEEALAHSWMAASADPSTTKSLSKEKMKRFLARQKWKVAELKDHARILTGDTLLWDGQWMTLDTDPGVCFVFDLQKAGKALLALKRMALRSKGDVPGSPTSPAEGKTLLINFPSPSQ